MKRKIMCDGSFSVEVALIMPFILSVTISCVFLLCGLHNRNALYNAACVGALTNVYYEALDNTSVKEKCAFKTAENVKEKLIGVNIPEIKVTVDNSKAVVYAEGQEGDFISPECEVNVERIHPGKVLRTINKVERIAEKSREIIEEPKEETGSQKEEDNQ